jgi:signal transduction histidine kinase
MTRPVSVDGGGTLELPSPRSGGRAVNASAGLAPPRRRWLAPPSEASQGFFGTTRRLVQEHPAATDAALAGGLLVVCTAWLVASPFAGLRPALVQVALITPLVWRRRFPVAVFVVIAVVGMFQWIFGPPLVADAALLVGLYTVAVHDARVRAFWATTVLELGACLAATRWHPADTLLRSLTFLTATVVAALCVGLTVRSGSEYLAWLAERARRLEIERDQHAVIVAAQERTRIAREMHDIVAHSLSVVVTLADAASTVSGSDPDRAAVAMSHASTVGRQALADMRTLIGVLRTDVMDADLVPQPGLAQLEDLLARVRATGLKVDTDVTGQAFSLGLTGELSIYRIVQESLTNTIKHAGATQVRVTIRYDRPLVTVQISDDGAGGARIGDDLSHVTGGSPPRDGHGIGGMRERAALHQGSLAAGPAKTGGWTVTAALRPDGVEAVV